MGVYSFTLERWLLLFDFNLPLKKFHKYFLVMNRTAQNYPIVKSYKRPFTFYLLSTSIPWAFWFYSGYLSHIEPTTKTLEWAIGITSIAGLIAPFIIALYFILPNKELRADLMGRFFNFGSIKREYILITFFLMLLSILAAQALSLFFGYDANQFRLRGSFTFTSSLFPVWFLLLAAPVFEELAWHSYGTDSLVSRFNLLTASLIFAIFWAFWHFPLSTIKGYYHSNLVESGWIYSVNFIVSMIPFALIINWIYYKTNRNILLPIIFHITAVFFNEIFATHPMSKVIQTGLLLIFCVYLVVKDRALFFNRL
jgi:membrane protease YdiL (CAAX protease family)